MFRDWLGVNLPERDGEISLASVVFFLFGGFFRDLFWLGLVWFVFPSSIKMSLSLPTSFTTFAFPTLSLCPTEMRGQ